MHDIAEDDQKSKTLREFCTVIFRAQADCWYVKSKVQEGSAGSRTQCMSGSGAYKHAQKTGGGGGGKRTKTSDWFPAPRPRAHVYHPVRNAGNIYPEINSPRHPLATPPARKAESENPPSSCIRAGVAPSRCRASSARSSARPEGWSCLRRGKGPG